MSKWFSFLVGVPLIALALPASAETLDNLLTKVERESGVPKEYLKKICTHESQSYHNKKRQPWPWTLNVQGRGLWFKSKKSALAYAALELYEGNRNFDVGLCQINWRWHSQRFSSLESAFDPATNIAAAASYLKEVKGNNSWSIAVGRYHSPNNNERAEKYRSRVLK